MQPDDKHFVRVQMERRAHVNGRQKPTLPWRLLPVFPASGQANVLVSRRPWRLFEISSRGPLARLLRHYTEAVREAQWTASLPLLQRTPAADLVARIVENAIDDVATANPGSKIDVVEFNSGPHPSTPFVEHLVNWRRARRRLSPVEFVITDPHPCLDDWIPVAERSAHLSFIPQEVSAVEPPIAAISDRFQTRDGNTSGSKIVRLFVGDFHRLNDSEALTAIRSVLDTADAVVIVEPLDRRLASLVFAVLEFWFCWLVTIFWFTWRPVQILLTYPFPILPFVLSFDRIIACLRWRTFDEMIQLVVAAEAEKPLAASRLIQPSRISDDYGLRHRKLEVGDWVFTGGRALHTQPCAYLTYFVGARQGRK